MTAALPDGEKGNDSDREGSLTPTNEAPPTLELDDPPTPKDEVSTQYSVSTESSLFGKGFLGLQDSKATSSSNLQEYIYCLPLMKI